MPSNRCVQDFYLHKATLLIKSSITNFINGSVVVPGLFPSLAGWTEYQQCSPALRPPPFWLQLLALPPCLYYSQLLPNMRYSLAGHKNATKNPPHLT